MKLFLKYWLPLLIWLGIMFVGSTDVLSSEQTSRFVVPFLRWLKPDITAEALAQIHFLLRKLAHVAEYAILAALLCRALGSGTTLRLRMSILLFTVWIVCVFFAASDEFHQSFVSSRTPSPRDVMIDMCGALVGLMICRIFAGREAQIGNRKLKRWA